jgi:PAS domain S-box-containing protein
MQHVKNNWLRIYNYCLVLLTAGLFSAYIAFEHFNVGVDIKDQWGITPIILILGLVHSVYTLSLYQYLNKRYTFAANFISFALYAYLFAAIIDTSGNTNTVYRLGYAVFIFFTALNGWITPMLAIILTWTVLLFTVVGIATPTKAGLVYNLILNTTVTCAGLLGWYIFKRWYIKKTDNETQQLEGLLEQEQSKFGVILESITDGVIIIDPKGNIQVINESAARMLEWPKDEAVSLDYRSIITVFEENNKDPNSNKTAISLSLTSNKSEQKISLLKTKNQHQVYVDIVASPIMQKYKQVESGKITEKIVGVVAVLRNVDEQKRQEQQRSDFISTASHEMRTPVASIQGFVELALNSKVATIDDKARGYLEKAHESTKHLGQLFQDLLTTSQSDDGRLSNNPKVIELTEFLQAVVEQDQPAATKKNLSLVFDAKNGSEKNIAPLIYIHVDPDRLREVISNIIENAIKYTESGMVTVGVTLKETSAVMRVSDTGMGIAEEDIPHLFQKFYRTDNSATREIGGTGLGLYICKQIIDMMGGKIWAESTVGAGSTFYIEIPRVDPSNVAKQSPA